MDTERHEVIDGGNGPGKVTGPCESANQAVPKGFSPSGAGNGHYVPVTQTGRLPIEQAHSSVLDGAGRGGSLTNIPALLSCAFSTFRWLGTIEDMGALGPEIELERAISSGAPRDLVNALVYAREYAERRNAAVPVYTIDAALSWLPPPRVARFECADCGLTYDRDRVRPWLCSSCAENERMES